MDADCAWGRVFDIRLYEEESGIASKVPTLYEWLGGSELLSALIERFHERFRPNSRDDRIDVENLADVSGAGLAASQIGQSLQLAITKDKAEYYATLTSRSTGGARTPAGDVPHSDQYRD